MILLILLIYFILLIFIELFCIYSISNNKKKIIVENCENLDDLFIKKKKLKKYISNDDINLDNYFGKLLIENKYGFYINDDNWNLLIPKKLYDFKVPVNIKVIKINNNEDIEYFINS